MEQPLRLETRPVGERHPYVGAVVRHTDAGPFSGLGWKANVSHSGVAESKAASNPLLETLDHRCRRPGTMTRGGLE
jgi:hypothetical protein